MTQICFRHLAQEKSVGEDDVTCLAMSRRSVSRTYEYTGSTERVEVVSGGSIRERFGRTKGCLERLGSGSKFSGSSELEAM